MNSNLDFGSASQQCYTAHKLNSSQGEAILHIYKALFKLIGTKSLPLDGTGFCAAWIDSVK